MRFDDLYVRIINESNDVDVKVLKLELEQEMPYVPGMYSGWANLQVTEHREGRTVTKPAVIRLTPVGYFLLNAGEHGNTDPLDAKFLFSDQAIKAIHDLAKKLFTKDYYYKQQVKTHLQDSDDLGFGDLDL
jgi:hypothetical protein